MKSIFVCCFLVVAVVVAVAQPSLQASECQVKRSRALELVQQQAKNQSLGLAIVVPNCNDDGTFATLQCHHNSNFCQCWDKEGIPMTQPKKNLKKCTCMIDRAKALKSIPPSQTDMPELTSCETDGSYTAKQCSRQACWCVNPDTGAKLTAENKDKAVVKC